jgi:uncharacterized protein (TIGR02147 family)
MTAGMKIFEFDDYREFIRFRVESSPRKGHGQYRKIADFLAIPTSLVSQIMSGVRELNLESAALLIEYFTLTELEADYFLNLVELARAGNEPLRLRIRARLKEAREKGSQIKQRIRHERELSNEESQQFYSQWFYSGVRLMTSIPGMNTPDRIAAALKLQPNAVAKVLEFLSTTGLCIEREGEFFLGPQSTHVSNDSPIVLRHHMNWRVKTLAQLTHPKPHEMIFTGPVTLSNEARMEVKQRLLQLIAEWGEIVDASKEGALSCLNIDWVDIAL